MDWLLGLTNAYDVMGLAPDATQQEIDDQFDLLVRRKGYRIGMRRSSWRRRLDDIQSAYATLGDPDKRRAYDESLDVASTATPWAVGAASDAPTDSLVRPARAHRAPRQAAKGPGGGGKRALKSNGLPPAALVASENAETSRKVPEPSSAPRTGKPEADASDARSEVVEPTQGPDVEDSWAVRRRPAKALAIPAVATLGAAAILFATWQQQEPQNPSISAARSPAATEQPRTGTTGGAVAPATFAGVDATSELSAEEQAAAAADKAAASASLSQWLGPEGSAATASRAPSMAGSPPSEAKAESSAGAPVPEQSVLAANQVPPIATRVAAPPQAAAPATVAVSRIVPIPTAAPSNSVAKPSVDLSRPSQLIIGGPGDSDNRRGRYRGSLDVQLTVSAEGRVSECSVVRTSGNSELDALTCRIVRERSRFTPAQDAQGRAVSSRANATYVWGRGRRSKK